MEFADESNVGEELEARDRHELVEQALQKLPTAQRVPLVLYHLKDCATRKSPGNSACRWAR